MKKQLTAIIVLAIISVFDLSGQITFENFYQFSNCQNQEGNFVVQTFDGGYYVAGELEFINDTNRIFVMRTNQFGDTLWLKVFGKLDDSRFNDASITSDSGLIIIGGNTKAISADYYNEVYIVKLDLNGDTVWTKTDSTIGSFENHILQTFNGGYAFTSEGDTAGSKRICLNFADASGNIMWAYTFHALHAEYPSFLIQTSDSGFAIAGYQMSAMGDSTMALILRTDASGNQLWKKYYQYTSHNGADGLIQKNDGGLLLAGDEENDFTHNDKIFLINTNPAGDTLWTKRLGDSSEDINPHHIALCSDGGYFIISTIEDSVSEYLFILRTDSVGDTIWSKRIHYAEADWAQQTSDFGFIITGNGYNGSSSAYLLRLDTAGNFTSSIPEYETGYSIEVFPNPVSGHFVIYSAQQPFKTVEIYDVYGKRMYAAEVNNELINVNCSSFASGIYFLKVSDEKKQFKKKVVVVNN
jgi:hypothetical protein